ncbi:hypothetical protein ADL19_15015 [Streptomyces purpurogeneiscleroticus]|nr:hypothetical protein ADL19_15015 [Streptomyces purpurogeneiscleroticus]
MNDNMTHLEKDFHIFHRDNPKVYELFKKFTKEVIDAGFTHHSARDIMRRIVWETTIVTTDDQYKINNNHTPYYARLWMQQHPEYPGFFRTRAVREAA